MRHDKKRMTENYIQQFIEFSNKMERCFKVILWICMLLLVISQIALRIPSVRGFISPIDRMEGVPLPVQEDNSPHQN